MWANFRLEFKKNYFRKFQQWNRQWQIFHHVCSYQRCSLRSLDSPLLTLVDSVAFLFMYKLAPCVVFSLLWFVILRWSCKNLTFSCAISFRFTDLSKRLFPYIHIECIQKRSWMLTPRMWSSRWLYKQTRHRWLCDLTGIFVFQQKIVITEES